MTFTTTEKLNNIVIKELRENDLYLALNISKEEDIAIDDFDIARVDFPVGEDILSAIKGADLPVLMSAGSAVVGIREAGGMNIIMVTKPEHINALFDSGMVDIPFSKEQCMNDAKLITEVVQYGMLQAGAPVSEDNLDWVVEMMNTRFKHFKARTESRLQDQLDLLKDKPCKIVVTKLGGDVSMISKCLEICKSIDHHQAQLLVNKTMRNEMHIERFDNIRVAIQLGVIRFDTMDVTTGEVLVTEYYTCSDTRCGYWMAMESGMLLGHINSRNNYSVPVLAISDGELQDIIMGLSGEEQITRQAMHALRKGKHYAIASGNFGVIIEDSIAEITLINTDDSKVNTYYTISSGKDSKFWQQISITK